MYTSIWSMGVRFIYDEEATNKLAMGGRGNVAPNLLDLVWLDIIYRVK